MNTQTHSPSLYVTSLLNLYQVLLSNIDAIDWGLLTYVLDWTPHSLSKPPPPLTVPTQCKLPPCLTYHDDHPPIRLVPRGPPYHSSPLLTPAVALQQVLLSNIDAIDWGLLPRALMGLLALLCGNGYIVGINQIYDVDIDAVNKPFLPVAAGGCV